MYRITQTTDNQHLGEVLLSAEPGQIITFADGDVVAVEKTFSNPDGTELVVISTNYQMTLVKE
jgi:hypothetical protein